MPASKKVSREIALTQGASLPAEYSARVNFEGWARSVVFGEKYREPDPDYLSRLLAAQAIMASSVEELFAERSPLGLQNMIEDTPGAKSPPLELTELYVTSSDMETGAPCYLIATCLNLETGEEVRFTTGALPVQSYLIALLKLGVNPVRFRIVRGDMKDKGGKHLLTVQPPE